MNPTKSVHVFVDTPDNHRRELTFHEIQATGQKIKESACVPVGDELALLRDGRLKPIANDELVELREGETFIVLIHQIRVTVHYIAASRPFKTAVEPTTTVGTVKSETLSAFDLHEDKTKVYKLFYHKTELGNLEQTIGQLAGHHKHIELKLEEHLIRANSVMADELSKLNFDQDFAEVQSLGEAACWKLNVVGDLELLVEVSSGQVPNEVFQARLKWAVYPDVPSLKFRDQSSGRLDMPSAWPVVRGSNPKVWMPARTSPWKASIFILNGGTTPTSGGTPKAMRSCGLSGRCKARWTATARVATSNDLLPGRK